TIIETTITSPDATIGNRNFERGAPTQILLSTSRRVVSSPSSPSPHEREHILMTRSENIIAVRLNALTPPKAIVVDFNATYPRLLFDERWAGARITLAKPQIDG